ncbi:MAG: type II toxin-antitoxin system RelE/ParE family toxin [Fimbriiglobus sp.]
MGFEVVWTERALAELESAVRYVAEDDPDAGGRLRQHILSSIEVLATFPFIGPAYDRDRTGRTREILSGPYRVFYRVDEAPGRVVVLVVWHGSRREPRLPGR